MGKDQFGIHDIKSYTEGTFAADTARSLHEGYSIVWVQEGTGCIQTSRDKFEIDNGTIYFVKPGQVILLTVSEEACGLVIYFKKEYLDLYDKEPTELVTTNLFRQRERLAAIKINPKTGGIMRNIVGKMSLEFKNYYGPGSEIVMGLLKILLIYLSRSMESNDDQNLQSRRIELAKTFQSLVEKHFSSRKMVRDYAELLSVNPNYLNDTVKEVSGFTASYHIQQRIIAEAKRKAIYEGQSMKEIAFHLGFWDPAHFSKYFKNISGESFTDFRKDITVPQQSWNG